MGVRNFILFLGQVIRGSTVGAPLSTSSTGTLTSGISSLGVSTAANTTSTSLTDVLIGGMTITPAAGTYNVWFVTTLEGSNNNINIFVSIYSGGSQVLGTEVVATPQIQGGVTPSLNQRVPITSLCQTVANGSQAIEARWRVSGASTATARGRTLLISRVA